ncbi:MAG: hypothetical protein EAZ20_00160 [Bacteroidetes bacterium]|nr:MAG: hypothetical protein EAZ20_00160 [Bacteroidota bacterium]
MKLHRYEYLTEGNAELYKFTSVGPNGEIKKLVVYSPMLEDDIYNLAFGDYNETTDLIDDKVATNNDDSQKVLATVASTLYVFTNKHPNIWIYATGSTASRTRLYRMGINKYYDIVVNDFEIMGEYKNEWENYMFGKDYQAFAVHRKNTKFEL